MKDWISRRERLTEH